MVRLPTPDYSNSVGRLPAADHSPKEAASDESDHASFSFFASTHDEVAKNVIPSRPSVPMQEGHRIVSITHLEPTKRKSGQFAFPVEGASVRNILQRLETKVNGEEEGPRNAEALPQHEEIDVSVAERKFSEHAAQHNQENHPEAGHHYTRDVGHLDEQQIAQSLRASQHTVQHPYSRQVGHIDTRAPPKAAAVPSSYTREVDRLAGAESIRPTATDINIRAVAPGRQARQPAQRERPARSPSPSPPPPPPVWVPPPSVVARNKRSSPPPLPPPPPPPPAGPIVDVDMHDPATAKAAVKIQAVFRGHQTRKAVQPLASPSGIAGGGSHAYSRQIGHLDQGSIQSKFSASGHRAQHGYTREVGKLNIQAVEKKIGSPQVERHGYTREVGKINVDAVEKKIGSPQVERHGYTREVGKINVNAVEKKIGSPAETRHGYTRDVGHLDGRKAESGLRFSMHPTEPSYTRAVGQRTPPPRRSSSSRNYVMPASVQLPAEDFHFAEGYDSYFKSS